MTKRHILYHKVRILTDDKSLMQSLDQVRLHKLFPTLHQYTHGPLHLAQMVRRPAQHHHHYRELLKSSQKYYQEGPY